MKVFYTLLIIFFPAIIFAQSNYQPGYILQNNGDTLKGYINYREWDQNPKVIDFKNAPGDEQATQFTPLNVKGFGVNGLETYITYKGLLSMNRTNFSSLPEHMDTTRKMASVFLKQLVTGKYFTLYSSYDDVKTRFLIAEKGSTPLELKYYEYFNDTHDIVRSATYKGQLTFYFGKYYPGKNHLSDRIEYAKYDYSDLESLINEANNEKGDVTKKTSVRFFAGLALASTKVYVNNINEIDGRQSLTVSTPKINLGIDLFGNPNVQKFIFRMELSLSYINPHFKYDIDPHYSIKSTTNVDYTFNQYTAGLTPQVLFNLYNKANLKIYIDGGVGFNLSVYSNQKLLLKNTTIYNAVTNSETDKPYRLNGFWPVFPAQAGVILNNTLEFYVTYISNSNLTASSNATSSLRASSQAINVGAKYLFGKK